MPTWNVIEARRPILNVFCPPSVYRYLEQRYVDQLFESGILRLSSFSKFAKHSDEQRFDAGEGKGYVKGVGKTKDGVVQARARTGENSYILCASTIQDPNLSAQFGCDGGFEIYDTIRFALAVSQHIPGFPGGREGHCVYTDPRMVFTHSDDFAVEAGFETGQEAALRAEETLMFIKPQRYCHQAEYRFIWDTEHGVGAHLDIACPEALEFCRRLP